MVEKINSLIKQNNYNTISGVKNTAVPNCEKATNTNYIPQFTASSGVINSPTQNIQLRTSLDTKDEKNKYTKVVSRLDKNGRKV